MTRSSRLGISAMRVFSSERELSTEDRWGLIGITSVVLVLAAQLIPIWLVVVAALPFAYGVAILLDLISDQSDPGADVQGPASGWRQSDAEPAEPGVVREVFAPMIAAACCFGVAVDRDDSTRSAFYAIWGLYLLFLAGAGIRSRFQKEADLADDVEKAGE